MSRLEDTKICAIPWSDMIIGSNYVSVCCYQTSIIEALDSPWSGPWDGDFDKYRNAKPFVEFRKKILELGIDEVCKGCPCFQRNVYLKLKNQLSYCSDNTLKNRIFTAIEEGLTVLDFPPLSFSIDATLKCQSKCSYCCRNINLPSNDDFLSPSLEQIRTISQYISKSKRCIFTGGEPFILPDEKLDAYFLPLKNLDTVHVITNGIELTLERYERYCPSPVNYIEITIDTLNPEHYKLQRRHSINPVLKNIKGIKSKYPNEKVIRLKVTLTELSLLGLKDLVNFCKLYNIPGISVTPVLGLQTREYGDVIKNTNFFDPEVITMEKYERFKNLMEECVEHAKSNGIFLSGMKCCLEELERAKLSIK